MFKTLINIFILLGLSSCNEKPEAPEIKKENLCKYFTLTTALFQGDTGSGFSTSPEIVYFNGDKFSAFIKTYTNRFDYLQFEALKAINFKLFDYDSAQLKLAFCRQVNTDAFYENILLLTPGKSDQTEKKIQYSKAEYMKVASRFFFCDQLNKKDTTVGYHICVGINGQKDFVSEKALAALQAFAFEAIFYNMLRSKEPDFEKNFNQYIAIVISEEKQRFTDFKTFLNSVRNSCYERMENDKDLEDAVMNYYQKNRNTVSFMIQ